jgi:hypothetical protein
MPSFSCVKLQLHRWPTGEAAIETWDFDRRWHFAHPIERASSADAFVKTNVAKPTYRSRRANRERPSTI